MTQNRFFLGILVLGLLMGCKDDFNEENLLQTQVELAEQQEIDKADRATETLNELGDLLSYSVKVVSQDNQPVSGASVTLQAATPTGSEVDQQILTTDANGEAFFSRARIGGNLLSVSADGFLDIIANLDFGPIEEGKHYQIIDGLVVPTPVTESSVIPLFPDAMASDAATISGMVTIETDLTDGTPEVPQDLTLRVNLANFADQFNTGGSITPQIYSFSDDVVIGKTQVDNATGAYSMQVPALGDDINLELLVPDIATHQRLAITQRNGQPLPRPEYAEIPTNFGPNWTADSSIPHVPGVIWVFDEPPTPGNGFDLSYEKIGRGFQDILFTTYDFADYVDTAPLTDDLGFESTIIETTSFGSNLIDAPLFDVNDPTGNNAVGVVSLEFAIDSLVLTKAGNGFMPNTEVDFDFYYDVRFYKNEDGVLEVEESTDLAPDLGIDLKVMTDAFGDITPANIEAALQVAIANQDDGYNPEDPYTIFGGAGQFNLRFQSQFNVDDATCIIDVVGVSVGRAKSFQLWTPNDSDGYTNPTFDFYGGGGEAGFTLPSIEVVSFGTQWQVIPNNIGVTAPYTITPPSVTMKYLPITTSYPISPEHETELLDENDSAINIVELLESDTDGNIQFANQLSTFKTPFFSESMPHTLITEPYALSASVQVESITVDEQGTITNYNLDDLETGAGYTDQFMVSIEPAAEGAPGSGAQADLVFGTLAANGEYIWGGDANLKSGGSGYLENLNQKSPQAFEGSFNQPIQAGKTYIANIRYGTGQRQEQVN
ncbi:carboxypeptidase-like regulatory domain-containing protein [Flagellimonas sp.]|uniref:carboxypeptidase-like regulatory domain-containing protein n=1 Tax=Flagellimonas sp. TaxID=2058762 RepID=UPI003F4A1AD6